MKKIIQSFSIIVSIISLILFLYGSIKLSRIESGNTLQNIETGIPGVEIVQPSNPLTREDVQGIIAVSVAGLVIGIGGYVISSNMEEKQKGISITTDDIGTEEPYNTTGKGTEEPEKGSEINQQPTEDTSDTEKISVEPQTESSTEEKPEEKATPEPQSKPPNEENPTENTSDTKEKIPVESQTESSTQNQKEENQEINQQPTEDTSDTEKISVEPQTESSTENQKEENQEINQQPTENTSDTEEKKSNDSPENS